jgi:hypothetical protein
VLQKSAENRMPTYPGESNNSFKEFIENSAIEL